MEYRHVRIWWHKAKPVLFRSRTCNQRIEEQASLFSGLLAGGCVLPKALLKPRQGCAFAFHSRLFGSCWGSIKAKEIEKADSCRWKQGSDKCLFVLPTVLASVMGFLFCFCFFVDLQKESSEPLTPDTDLQLSAWLGRILVYLMPVLKCKKKMKIIMRAHKCCCEGAKFYF